MNVKTTLTLIALVAIVGVLWLFLPSREETEPADTPELPPSRTEPVFDPEPETDTITRVVLERPDEPRIVFARVEPDDDVTGPQKWRIVEPLSARADSAQVNSMCRTFLTLRSRTRLGPDLLSAADAGLEPPAATLTFADDQGKEHKLEIGKQAVMSTDTYVRAAGAEVIHVANRDLLPMIKKEIGDLRDKRLIELKPDYVTAVYIEHEGRTYDLTRGADDQWVINEPVHAYADTEQVRALVRKFNGLRVVEFVDDAPTSLARYGLQPPYLSIRVTTETRREIPAEPSDTETQPVEPQYETVSETHAVQLGGLAGLKEEERYVKLPDQPWVAVVSKASADQLEPDLNDLRDPRIARVTAARVTELTLTVGDSSATLKRVGGRWQGSGDLTDPDAAAVTDVLEALEDLQAVSYIDEPASLAEYGLEPPRAELRVVVAGEVDPVTLRVGSDTASGRNAHVQREGDATVIVTSAAQAARLVVSPLELRSREMFDFPVSQLETVKVERGERLYELVREGNEWKLTVPEGAPVALVSARNLANDLARLRAARVVARGEPAAYGLDRPALAIHFEVATSPPATTQETAPQPPTLHEHALHVGVVDGVAYAQVDDDAHIFELDPTVYEVLTAELIDTRLFDFDARLVVAVRVEEAGETLELSQEDSVWRYTPEPYLELDQRKVNEFIGELAGLRAQSFVAYHDGDLAAAGLDAAPVTLTIQVGDGREFVLAVGPERAEETTRVAALVGAQRVFLLAEEDCGKLFRGLDDFLKLRQ